MPYNNRFKSTFIQVFLLAVFMSGLGVSGVANAGGGNNECPVGLVNNMTLNDEFGQGTSDLTNCLNRRSNVNVVIKKIAELKQLDEEEVANNIYMNYQKLFL